MPVEHVCERYQKACGRWAGCDWPTTFGPGRLDLNGLKAAHALLLARATAGDEAAQWRDAARWLEQIERDARQAEDEAGRALLSMTNGEYERALTHARQACALESRYHARLVWGPLREAIEKALAAPEHVGPKFLSHSRPQHAEP